MEKLKKKLILKKKQKMLENVREKLCVEKDKTRKNAIKRQH